MGKNRSKIDDANSARLNRLSRSVVSTFEIIRHGFKCVKCGHTKAFYKKGGYECTRCKLIQKKK